MNTLNIFLQASPQSVGSWNNLIILVAIVVFWLVCRELVCWYYKINEKIKLQKKTNELLEQILNKLENNK